MSNNRNGMNLRLMVLILVSAAFILSLFGRVAAQDTIPAQNPGRSAGADSLQENYLGESLSRKVDDGSLTGPLLKLLVALVVIVAAIYGFLYLLRRMMGVRMAGNRSSRLIEVLETTYIAQKKSISLVRYADRAVLIGVADNSVSVLAELDSETTGKIMAEIASSGKAGAGFKNILDSAKGRVRSLSAGNFKAMLTSRETSETQTA
jgi:flagellar biosynthetic protein FliO